MIAMKKLLIGLVIAAVLLWLVFPLYIMIKISLSPADEVMTPHPSILTFHPTLKHWHEVLESRMIGQPLSKSLTVAAITMVITLLVAIPGAYGISRLPVRWQTVAILAMFFTRAFPEIGIALPIAIKFVKWNLIDTNIGLSLAHVIRVLPIASWILIGTFQNVPRDLEEQAEIDGCSKMRVLKDIILPLSLGGISVAAIFSWLFSWDEFTYALYLCLSEPTLPLKVYYYINRGSWFLTATYATVITIPVIIITYGLQRFIKSGYTKGALKG